jgi:hypothetical protein
MRENLAYGIIVLGSVVFLGWVIPANSPPYPGYGVSTSLLPNIAVGAILVLSLLALVKNLMAYRLTRIAGRQNGGSGKAIRSTTIPAADRVHLWHLTRFMALSVLLMPAMQLVGFIPAGLVFMLVLQYMCGQRKPLTMGLVSIVSIGVLYLAMRFGLGVPMP